MKTVEKFLIDVYYIFFGISKNYITPEIKYYSFLKEVRNSFHDFHTSIVDPLNMHLCEYLLFEFDEV